MVGKGLECWYSGVSEVRQTLLTYVGTIVMNEEVPSCSASGEVYCYSVSQCRNALVQLWTVAVLQRQSVENCVGTVVINKEVYQYSGSQ